MKQNLRSTGCKSNIKDLSARPQEDVPMIFYVSAIRLFFIKDMKQYVAGLMDNIGIWHFKASICGRDGNVEMRHGSLMGYMCDRS